MCPTTRNRVLGLLVAWLLMGCTCPKESPRTFTLELTAASIVADGGTATLTATLNLVYPDDVELTLEVEQTPEGDAVYELSAAQITIPTDQTQGTVTITSLALPAGVDQATLVFRITRIAFPKQSCHWPVDVTAGPLTIVPGEPPPPRPVPGTLKVSLSPAHAVSGGAQWNVDDGGWQKSGATVGGLSPGTHTVKYAAVTGWTAPTTETVTITEGQTLEITRSFAAVPGALKVTLAPAEAQGRWSVDGGAWQDSGATVTGLAPGMHSMAYDSKDGWTTPTSEDVTISNGQTLEITRSCAAVPGALKVTLTPAQAKGRLAVGQWRVDGRAWQDSGATVTGLVPGSHEISYRAEPGWTPPVSEEVTISNGQTLEITRNYSY